MLLGNIYTPYLEREVYRDYKYVLRLQLGPYRNESGLMKVARVTTGHAVWGTYSTSSAKFGSAPASISTLESFKSQFLIAHVRGVRSLCTHHPRYHLY